MDNTNIFTHSLQPFPFLSVCHYISSIGLLLLKNDSRLIDTQGQSIFVLNALFDYLKASENEMQAKRVLLQKILKGTDLYGGEENEILDEQYVNETYQYIISATLFASYGGIHRYLAGVINKSNNLMFSSLKREVFEDLSSKSVWNDRCSLRGYSTGDNDFKEDGHLQHNEDLEHFAEDLDFSGDKLQDGKYFKYFVGDEDFEKDEQLQDYDNYEYDAEDSQLQYDKQMNHSAEDDNLQHFTLIKLLAKDTNLSENDHMQQNQHFKRSAEDSNLQNNVHFKHCAENGNSAEDDKLQQNVHFKHSARNKTSSEGHLEHDVYLKHCAEDGHLQQRVHFINSAEDTNSAENVHIQHNEYFKHSAEDANSAENDHLQHMVHLKHFGQNNNFADVVHLQHYKHFKRSAEDKYSTKNTHLKLKEHPKLSPLSISKIFQNHVWCIFPEPVEDTNIFDVNYIYAMAGLKIARTLGSNLKNLTFDDYILLAHTTKIKALRSKSRTSALETFSIPALFYFAHKEKEKYKSHNITNDKFWQEAYPMLFSYLNKNVDKIVESTFKESHYYKLHTELTKLTSRTEIAAGLLLFYCKISISALSSAVPIYKTTEWMARVMFRCSDLPSLEEVFQNQFQTVRDTYFQIEKNSVEQALIAGNLMTKINLPDTSVHLAVLPPHEMTCMYCPPNFRKVNSDIYLMFAIEQKTEKELKFYALKQAENALILLVNEGHEDTFAKALGVDFTIKLERSLFAKSLKRKEENFTDFVERVAGMKTDLFIKRLSDHYYEPTFGEKVINVITSLIPFYSCIQDIRSGNHALGIFSCSLDVLTLIPLVGVATKYATIISSRFALEIQKATANTFFKTGTGLAIRVGLSGIFQAATKTVTSMFTLTKSFLIDLSIATVRALDPGFELSYKLSKYGYNFFGKLFKHQFQNAERLSMFLNLRNKISLKLIRNSGPVDGTGLVSSVVDRFMDREVIRYMYPGGSHFFGPKCLKLSDGVAELRTIGDFKTYVVPSKAGQHSGFYRAVDVKSGELSDWDLEMDDRSLLSPARGSEIELKIFEEEDVREFTFVVHEAPEVENLAGDEYKKKVVQPEIDDKQLPMFADGEEKVGVGESVRKDLTEPEDLTKSNGLTVSEPKLPKEPDQKPISKIVIFVPEDKARILKTRRKNVIFTAENAVEYIVFKTGYKEPMVRLMIEQYLLSSMRTHSSILTYRQLAKDFVSYGSVPRKYYVYRLKQQLSTIPLIKSKNWNYVLESGFGKTANNIKSLHGSDFEEKYLVRFEEAENLYKGLSRRNLGFYDFCLVLAFRKNGLSVIKMNQELMKKTRIAFNRLILRHIDNTELLEPIELWFSEIIKNPRIVNFLKNEKRFFFNDITLVKKDASNVFDVGDIRPISLETKVVYHMKLESQFGVLDLGRVHPDFANEYIVYPDVKFRMKEGENVKKNVLVLDMENEELLKDDWRISRIRESDFLFGKEELLPREESIVKAAKLIVSNVPLITEQMARNVLKTYILELGPIPHLVITYENLAEIWIKNLKVPDFYDLWKIKNSEFIDDLLFKKRLDDIQDFRQAYQKIFKLYQRTYRGFLEREFRAYVSSPALRYSLRFEDYYIIRSYKNNMIVKDKHTSRRRDAAFLRLALRQCEENWGAESIRLYHGTRAGLEKYEKYKSMKEKDSFWFAGNQQVSVDLKSELKREENQFVSSSLRILFDITVNKQFGIVDLGRVFASEQGKHLIFPKTKFVVDSVSEEVIDMEAVLIIKLHDLNVPKEIRMVELIKDLEALYRQDTVFYIP